MKEYNLQRFVDAQNADYEMALSEIKKGRKRSHWIWYIFPQFKEFAHSHIADYYGIEDKGEAEAYLLHPILGIRIRRISEALLQHRGKDVKDIFGDFKPCQRVARGASAGADGSIQIIHFTVCGNDRRRLLVRDVLDKRILGAVHRQGLCRRRIEIRSHSQQAVDRFCGVIGIGHAQIRRRFIIVCGSSFPSLGGFVIPSIHRILL